MTDISEQVDVVIAGGGMVGASLAVALSVLPIKTVLVEAAPLAVTQKPGYDDRAIALSYGSQQIIQGLGIWQDVSAAANPIDSIHVSDRGHFGATRLSAKQQMVAALGYLIQAQDYGQVLHRRLEASGIHVMQPASLRAIQNNGEAVLVDVLADGKASTLETKLLVACDGANSAVRGMAGMTATTYDYEQVAIIANITTEVPHENRAFERFTDQGPIALLPMAGNRCSLVWTLKTDAYQAVMDFSDAEFLAALGDAFGYRLGRFTRVGTRSVYPLKLTESSDFITDRVAVIGNAAHSLHPVAGQGLNLALRDIADLAEQLSLAVNADADLGSQLVLQAYLQARKNDTARTIKYTDSLVKIFSNQQFLLGHARALGLTLVDRVFPLRTILAEQSMGLLSRRSRLARGLPLQKVML